MVGRDVDIGKVLKKSFSSIIHDPGYIVLYALPIIVSWAFIALFWYLFDFNITSFSDPNLISSFFGENLLLLIGGIVIFIIVMIIVYVTVVAALIKKVFVQEQGEKLPLGDALRDGFQVFPRLFVAMILFGLVIVVPLVALIGLMMLGIVTNMTALICLASGLLIIIIIPMIYFGLRLYLFKQSCVLENKGALDSLKHSWHITKSNVLNIFVVLLIIALIALVIMIPFMIANAALTFNTMFSQGFNLSDPSSFNQTSMWSQGLGTSTIINSIGQIIVQLIIGPVTEIALTLVFLNLIKPAGGQDLEEAKKRLEVDEWPD